MNIKLPNMPRPGDFENLKNSEVVYTGLFNEYKTADEAQSESA